VVSCLEMGQYPCKLIFQENIKALREVAREAIHREIIDYAKVEKIGTGRKVRIDATAVETDIQRPTDLNLLADGVRSITHWLAEGKEPSPTSSYSSATIVRWPKNKL